MRFAITTVLSCLFVASAIAAPVQWPSASGGNDHWYEVVYVGPAGIAWTAARTAAENAGGYLATLTSAAENEFVYDLVKDDPNLWPADSFGGNGVGPYIGGYQIAGSAEPGGGWAWVTGEEWNYTNWCPNEPNNSNGGTEAYLHYFWPIGTNGQVKGPTWNDLADSIPLGVRGYIVEYVPEPASAMLVLLGALVFAGRRSN